MFKTAALAAAGLLALAASPATAPPATPPAVAPDLAGKIPTLLEWRIGPGSAAAGPGSVDFELGFHSEFHSWMSKTVAVVGAHMVGAKLSDMTQGLTIGQPLSGLPADRLARASGPVDFVVRRDAGDFHCHGVAGEGRGSGTCIYAANPGFPAALAQRGVTGAVQAYPQFLLTLYDIGFTYLDELKRDGYATPSADTLGRAGPHGAGLKQLRALDAAGYRLGDVESLIRVRDHGVSARYVEALSRYGYAGLTADDLLRLYDHGVTTTFLGDLHAAGYDHLSADDVVRLRDHGVSSSFIRASSHGGAHLTPDDLIRLRDHGPKS